MNLISFRMQQNMSRLKRGRRHW